MPSHPACIPVPFSYWMNVIQKLKTQWMLIKISLAPLYLIAFIHWSCQYILRCKGRELGPLLAFKVKDSLKIWTKFIERIQIDPEQPNPEQFSNCSEVLWISADGVAPELFGGRGGLFEVLRIFFGWNHSTSLNCSLKIGLWPHLRPKNALFLQFLWPSRPQTAKACILLHSNGQIS